MKGKPSADSWNELCDSKSELIISSLFPILFYSVSEPKVLKVSVKPNGTKTIFFRAAGTIEPQSFFDSRNQHVSRFIL